MPTTNFLSFFITWWLLSDICALCLSGIQLNSLVPVLNAGLGFNTLTVSGGATALPNLGINWLSAIATMVSFNFPIFTGNWSYIRLIYAPIGLAVVIGLFIAVAFVIGNIVTNLFPH